MYIHIRIKLPVLLSCRYDLVASNKIVTLHNKNSRSSDETSLFSILYHVESLRHTHDIEKFVHSYLLNLVVLLFAQKYKLMLSNITTRKGNPLIPET